MVRIDLFIRLNTPTHEHVSKMYFLIRPVICSFHSENLSDQIKLDLLYHPSSNILQSNSYQYFSMHLFNVTLDWINESILNEFLKAYFCITIVPLRPFYIGTYTSSAFILTTV